MRQIAKERAGAGPLGSLDRLGRAGAGERFPSATGGDRAQVVLIRAADELMSQVQALDELAGAAAEPNAFYEPWMLLPAIRSFGARANLLFVLIYSGSPQRAGSPRTGEHGDEKATDPQELVAFFPLERVSRYRKLPFSVLRLWRYSQCGLCTPLVRRGQTKQAIAAFFNWLYSGDSGAQLVEFGFIDGEGDFATALKQHIAGTSIRKYQADRFSRALFRPAADAQSYMKQASGKRHRKDMARRESRLAAAGRLEYAMLSDPGEIDAWTERFLSLESAGWKGRTGSALATISGGRSFLTSILLDAFARNRLMMLGIKLDGKLIAAKCNLLAGAGSFAFKIAYDEAYAEYSPGLLLEVENIRRLHDMAGIEWMDSCAAPRHPMIDHLWPGRRVIETIIAPGGKAPGGFLVGAFPILQRIKRKVRAAIAALAKPAPRTLPNAVADGSRRIIKAQPTAAAKDTLMINKTSNSPYRQVAEPNALLSLSSPVFAERFGRTPFTIGHKLAGHPLFSIERLLELSKSLPQANVKYNSGQVEIGAGVYRGAATGLSIDETIRQIDECGAWMVLKFVEQDSEYRELLDACLDQVMFHSDSIEAGMCRREGFIFISSPGSITPYHIDPEYNFLLQIRGAKTINVLDGADRCVLSEAEIENFFSGRKHQIAFDDLYLNKATSFVLKPGDGIHVPPAAPHWVQNGPEVCISFSITFRTRGLERRALIYGANSHLRRLGLNPGPPGSSRLMDSAKYLGYRALRRTGSVVRPILGSTAEPGSDR